MKSQERIIERQPETYIGIIEEILCSNADLNDNAIILIKTVFPKLKNGYRLKSLEAKQLESIYSYACRG